MNDQTEEKPKEQQPLLFPHVSRFLCSDSPVSLCQLHMWLKLRRLQR